MKKPTFLRSDTVRHIRLGKTKRRLQKWRRPKGRHSKMRRKHVGYPVQPGIGYKQAAPVSGLIKGKKPVHITTLKDMDSLQKGQLIIINRRIGARKRVDLLKKAHELHLSVLNAGGYAHESR